MTTSNIIVVIANETDFTSVSKSENITVTTESNGVSFETSTENIAVVFDDYNSTQFETDNTTASDLEMIMTSVLENTTTTTVQENSTVNVVADTTTDEVFESSTTEFVETTTKAETTTTTTTVKSKLCVDSEFECCPDGQTPAQVIELSITKNHVVF